jgi:hypothetical protein
VDVTVTKTVDIETVEIIVVEAEKKTLLKTVMGVQTAALPVTVDAGSVTVEALTVMVVGIHDDSIEVVAELNVTGPLEDVLDIDVTSVVITGPVATQEQELEILLGLLEHWETISGSPVESVLRVVVYVAQNADAAASHSIDGNNYHDCMIAAARPAAERNETSLRTCILVLSFSERKT